MANDRTGKPGAGTDAPPLLTFSVNDQRTVDELFPAHWAANAAQFYSVEFITGAAPQFGIDGAQIEMFMRLLGLISSLYFPSKNVISDDQQQIAVRDELNAVENTLRNLFDRLNNLSSLARDRLWCELWGHPDRPPGLIGLADIETPKPFPDEKPVLETLDALRQRVQARLADLQDVKNPGGRPERMDIRVLVSAARDFWVKVLHRKFAYQVVRGVPKSEAFDFCKHLLGPLDASVTDQELATAIRKAVKSQHPGRHFRPS